MRSETSLRVTAGALALSVMAACGGGGGGGPTQPDPPAPSSIAVMAAGPPPRFQPASALLAVGGTVTWTNTSPGTHNLIVTTANWEPNQLGRNIEPGESFSTTINQAGTHGYECTIHPGMTGQIIVR